MTTVRKFLMIFGGLLLLTSAVQLVRFYAQPADIWWTPSDLALSLDEASDRVQVTLRGSALPDQLAAGRVQLATDSGASPIAAPDIRVRLNHWDRVRAERIPLVLMSGIGLGAAVVLLSFGVLGWGPARPRESAG